MLMIPTSSAHSTPPIHLPFHHLGSKHIVTKSQRIKEQYNSILQHYVVPVRETPRRVPAARQRETARLPRAPPFAQNPPAVMVHTLYGVGAAHGLRVCFAVPYSAFVSMC